MPQIFQKENFVLEFQVSIFLATKPFVDRFNSAKSSSKTVEGQIDFTESTTAKHSANFIELQLCSRRDQVTFEGYFY